MFHNSQPGNLTRHHQTMLIPLTIGSWLMAGDWSHLPHLLIIIGKVGWSQSLRIILIYIYRNTLKPVVWTVYGVCVMVFLSTCGRIWALSVRVISPASPPVGNYSDEPSPATLPRLSSICSLHCFIKMIKISSIISKCCFSPGNVDGVIGRSCEF